MLGRLEGILSQNWELKLFVKSNYSCGVEGKLSPSPHTTKVTQFPLCHTSSIYFLKMNISGVFSSDWGKGRHKGYILERKKVKM